MTAKEHILQRLNSIKALPKSEPLKSPDELGNFIFQTLTSKKYRKYSLSDENKAHIKSAIELNIKNNQPIKLAFSFGGYKLWRLEETPTPDWAEIFTLIYYSRWLKPICDVYEPGIWFDFVTDGVILEKLNNIPKEDSVMYRNEFSQLLDFMKSFVPTNLKYTLTEVGDFYSSAQEFEEDLQDKITKMQATLENGLPILSEDDRASVELNVKLTAEQTEDPLWREKAKLIHGAYMTVSKKRPYYKTPDKIMVVVNALNGMLAVGTTKTSVAKFWVGAGALKNTEDDFKEYVLTVKQLKEAKSAWEPISIEGLEGKNFNRIRVI